MKKAKDLVPGDRFIFVGKRKVREVVANIELVETDLVPRHFVGQHLIVDEHCKQFRCPADLEVKLVS